MKIELGHLVRDQITKFEGLVTGLCQYITGCSQALVVPEIKKDGVLPESRWFDLDRLVILNKDPFVLEVSHPGPDKPAPKR